MIYLNHYLKESEQEAKPGMTLYDYIVNVCDGEIDMDVSDKDIDMMVAFCHDVNNTDNEYPEMTRFLNLIAKRTKIVKQINGGYAPVLVCDFSSALKPYNDKWKEFFNMDYSEFDEDEAYYEAVVNLEPLISGNASEETYKEFCDIMEGKKENIAEGEQEANEAYYKVNDVALKLQEVKPYIEEDSEAEKIYSSIMIELNDLQMNLHNTLLKEDMSDAEMVEKIKQGIQEGLNKSNSMSDIAGVIDYYRTFIKGYLGEDNIPGECEKHIFEGSDYGSEDWKCFEHHKNEFKDYYELPHGILFRDKNKPIYGIIMGGKFMLDAEPIPKDGKYRTDNSTLDTIELKDEDFSPVEDFVTYYIPSDYKYDAVADGRCPYCNKKLTTNDEWSIKQYGMCQDCFENGVE